MRGILMHCKRAAFKDIRRSTRPFSIGQHVHDFSKLDERELVLVLLCMEKGDKLNFIKSAVNRIDTLISEFSMSNKILVMPFAHLSNNLEKPEKSIKALEKFRNYLSDIGYNVLAGTFGTHKEALFHIKGHPASVSYFEFPHNN